MKKPPEGGVLFGRWNFWIDCGRRAASRGEVVRLGSSPLGE
jgi:hypothetical protein